MWNGKIIHYGLLLPVLFFVYSAVAFGSGDSPEIPFTIFDNATTTCTFVNTEKGALRIVKESIGKPDDFYYRVMPTPSVMKIGAKTQSSDTENPLYDMVPSWYEGGDISLIDSGTYAISETLPSADRWKVRKASCEILPTCGDGICDIGTQEDCNTCYRDCSQELRCPLSVEDSVTQPIITTPTGTWVPGSRVVENVSVIRGQTTRCEFRNEFITLKIVTQAIGGDGSDSFDYLIKGYDTESPTITRQSLNVLTDKKIRNDIRRGEEYTGSEGIFVAPAVTSYTITEESIPRGWTLNSVECALEDGTKVGTTTIYNYGIMNVTIQPNRMTTCTFVNTKKGDIILEKDASSAIAHPLFKGSETFRFEAMFRTSQYLPQLLLSFPLPRIEHRVKIDKNGKGALPRILAFANNQIASSSDTSLWGLQSIEALKGNHWIDALYNNEMFVAVADAGTKNRIVTSRDGHTWSGITGIADKKWQGVAYGDGVFVVIDGSVGDQVAVSSDGVSWILQDTLYNSPWTDMVYGKGLFVAVSSDGSIMTSPNGFGWKKRSVPQLHPWSAVAYDRGIFVIIAEDGEVITSENGVEWEHQQRMNGVGWKKIIQGKGVFVAMSSNSFATSSNGKVWTKYNSPVNGLESMSYDGDIFIAITRNGEVITSFDGASWVKKQSLGGTDWTTIVMMDPQTYPGVYDVLEFQPALQGLGAWIPKDAICYLQDGSVTGKNIGNGVGGVEVLAGQTTRCFFKNDIQQSELPGSGKNIDPKSPKKPEK